MRRPTDTGLVTIAAGTEKKWKFGLTSPNTVEILCDRQTFTWHLPPHGW
jgi:hypothetical protein